MLTSKFGTTAAWGHSFSIDSNTRQSWTLEAGHSSLRGRNWRGSRSMIRHRQLTDMGAIPRLTSQGRKAVSGTCGHDCVRYDLGRCKNDCPASAQWDEDLER